MLKKIILFSVCIGLSFATARAELFIYEDQATKLFGFKDKAGKVVIPAQFERIVDPTDHPLFSPLYPKTEFLVAVKKGGKIWRINAAGQAKFESFFFDNGADYYEEGLARFVEKGKIGFHDRQGNVVIQPEFDHALAFKNGYARVCKGCHVDMSKLPTQPPEVVGGKWGKINKQGEIMVPFVYDTIEAVDAAGP